MENRLITLITIVLFSSCHYSKKQDESFYIGTWTSDKFENGTVIILDLSKEKLGSLSIVDSLSGKCASTIDWHRANSEASAKEAELYINIYKREKCSENMKTEVKNETLKIFSSLATGYQNYQVVFLDQDRIGIKDEIFYRVKQ